MWSMSAVTRSATETRKNPQGLRTDQRAASSNAHQPRSATTALFRWRRSATIVLAPALISCPASSPPAWLPPTNPIAVMPAALAALTPAGELLCAEAGLEVSDTVGEGLRPSLGDPVLGHLGATRNEFFHPGRCFTSQPVGFGFGAG